MKISVSITNISGEINGNVAWKLESVVTALNKAINNISTIRHVSARKSYLHFGHITGAIFVFENTGVGKYKHL